MNQNDLDLALTNMAIALPSYKEETRFHNSEIVILEKYTIDNIYYDADKGEIQLNIKERDDAEQGSEDSSCPSI